MSEQNGTTIKFGAGYDVPWIHVVGTVDEQREAIAEAFRIELLEQTLAEIAVEASLVAHGLVNAATIGAKPKAKKAPAKQEPAKEEAKEEASGDGETKSIAQRAKSGTRKSTTARKSTKAKDPIADAIAKAKDADDLRKVWSDNKDNISDQHKELLKQRHKELSE